VIATSPQWDVLGGQPTWAVLTAVAILLFIIWCVIQWHLDQIENPSPPGQQLIIVAFDYSTAVDWCYRNAINPRWPDVHILTKPHHGAGLIVRTDDRIIDLHGPTSLLERLESDRRAGRLLDPPSDAR
jgi:hypothetical protein